MTDDIDPAIAALPVALIAADAQRAAAAGDLDAAPPQPIPDEAIFHVDGKRVVDASALYRASAEAMEDRRRAAEQAAEEARAAILDDRVLAMLDAAVPDDTALGIDTSSYGPRRAEYIRFVGHLRQLRERRDQAEAGRSAYLEQIGVPAALERRIEGLLADDTRAFTAWLRAGAAAALRPLLREQERSETEAALKRSRHEAEVAQAALAEVEDEVVVLGRVIAGLESRLPAVAQNALIEMAASVDLEFCDARDRMRQAMVRARALEQVVGPTRGALRDLSCFSVGMPVLPASLLIDEREIAAATAPWRDRLQRLLADPRAEFPDDNEVQVAAESQA